MEKFIVGKDECFLKKAVEIPGLHEQQLYVDMSGVSRLYPFGSPKIIEICAGNLIKITWKKVQREVVIRPTGWDKNIFKICLMRNEDSYDYTAPLVANGEILIQCINE